MFYVVVSEKGGSQKRLEFDKKEITIGRVQGNDIILPKGNVSKRHSRIVLKDGKFIIVDLKSTNGTYVNGRKISSPQVIKSSDRIYIGDFTLSVENADAEMEVMPSPLESSARPPMPANQPPPVAPMAPVAPVPVAPANPSMPPAPVARKPAAPKSEPPVVRPRAPVGNGAPLGGPMPAPTAMGNGLGAPGPVSPSPMAANPGAGMASPVAPRNKFNAPSAGDAAPVDTAAPDPFDSARRGPPPAQQPPLKLVPPEAAPVAAPVAPAPEAARPRLKAYFEPPLDESDPVRADRLRTRALILERLGEQIDITDPGQKGGPVPELWEQAHQIICDLVQEMAAQNELPAGIDQDRLIQDARAEALAIGPLEEFLVDEDVLEVFVNGPHQILTVRRAETRLEENAFATELGLLAAINRLLGASGRFLDQEKGGVDIKLRDGTRLVACFPPASSRGTTLLLRKYYREAPTLTELIAQGVLSEAAASFLEVCVRTRKTIAVTGAVSTGRGTLIQALAQAIPPEERVAVFAGNASFDVEHPQAFFLDGSVERKDTEESAFRYALRLGANRLIAHDLPLASSLDLISTLYGRADGALVGLLGHSAQDALERLAQSAQVGHKDLSAEVLREMVGRSFTVVVHLVRLADGSRRVDQIAEVFPVETPMEGVEGIATSDIFVMVNGQLMPTRQIPQFWQDLAARGEALNTAIFE